MKDQESKRVYWGIDISKSEFDVYHDGKSYVFNNRMSGFRAFLKLLGDGSHCVMEATGPYYLKLAFFLHKEGIGLSVVNPLVIKRFSQMRMVRAKTDKADARLIALYGEKENPASWSPPSNELLGAQQSQAVIEGLKKQIRALNNQLSSILVQPYQNQSVVKVLKDQISSLTSDAKRLEDSLLRDLEESYTDEMELLTSIPGIGKKTAVVLLVATQAFKRFPSCKQVASYAGICPRLYQSGTSVRGKGHITKMGGERIRGALYLAAWTASRFNTACKQLYERLVQKGKPKKLALIAVANKLLKQAFAVVKRKERYNPEYNFALVRN